MKIANWWKRIATSMVMAGALSPSLSHAASIALADPGFEVYTHTSGTSHEGFATLDYNTTAFSNNYTTGYRTPDGSHLQSAWIDDPGMGGFDGYYQDDDEAYHGSNYLFRSGTTGAGTRQRPQPRGNSGSNLQAMHGYYHYNGQVASGAVFEAGKTYKFSVYTQGSTNLSGNYGSYIVGNPGAKYWSSAVNLYIYDGTNPGYDGVNNGLESGALAKRFFEPACTAADCFPKGIGDFTNRGSSAVGTQADTNPAVPLTSSTTSLGWTQISVYHYVADGAPEVGHAIGVAFYGYYASNVDDASLESIVGNVPEPGTAALVCMAGFSLSGLGIGWRRRTDHNRGSG